MFESMQGREKSEQKRQKIDALLCHIFPFPPFVSEIDMFLPVAYTAIFNYFHMPSGSVPVTLIQEGEDKWDPIKDGGHPNDQTAQGIAKSMPGSVGLPISVQVASYPYRDEVVFRLMKEIEEEVNFNEKPPIEYLLD